MHTLRHAETLKLSADPAGGGPCFPSLAWSVPGEWPGRGVPAPDAPTHALPGPFRVHLPEAHQEQFATWSRYRDVELVGIGGMGRVYRACDARSGATVALKFPRCDERCGDGLREARLQGRLRHPGVLPVLDAGTLGGHPWFAMPYVEGRSLKSVRRELRLDAAVRLIAGVARVAHALHRAGLVHCDLNPRNILVAGRSAPRRVWVIDFGIAREMSSPPPTQISRVIGTPAYMAPEQALGRLDEVDGRTDVYALGATLYELVCGQSPFRGATSEVVLTKAIKEPPRPLHDLNADVPERLERVILRCLEKDGRDRFRTAAELASALEDCLDGN